MLAQAYAQCAVEIGGRLGEVVRLEGATVEEIRAAFVQQTNRVSDLSRAVAEANAVIGTANIELAAARDRHEDLSRAAAEANTALETTNRELSAACAIKHRVE